MQVPVLMVAKVIKDEEADAIEAANEPAQYAFELEVAFVGPKTSQVAFIKRQGKLDSYNSVASQMQVLVVLLSDSF